MKCCYSLPYFLSDVYVLWMIAWVAVAVGVGLNMFRASPLPLVYASKAERIQQAAERLAQRSSMDSVPDVLLAEGKPPQGDLTRPLPADAPPVQSIDLPTFQEMLRKTLVLDARPEIFHRLGHVPTALALPRDDFETYYTKHRSTLERYKDQPIAIYCTGGRCEDGEMVANALLRLGFKQLFLFRGGWYAWTHARLPEEKNL